MLGGSFVVLFAQNRPTKQVSRSLSFDALAPHAEPDEAGGQAAQDRKSDEESQEPWRHGFAGAAEDTGDYSFLNDNLDRLDDFRWPFAPLLHLRQKPIAQRSLAEQRPG